MIDELEEKGNGKGERRFPIVPVEIAVVHSVEKCGHSENKHQGNAIYAGRNVLGPRRRTLTKLENADHGWYNEYTVSRNVRHVFYVSRNVSLIRARSWIHPFYPTTVSTVLFFVSALSPSIKLHFIIFIIKFKKSQSENYY